MRVSRGIVVMVGISVLLAAEVKGAVVRGKVLHQATGAAAAGITVTISTPDGKRSPAASSGADGLFYINNATAGPHTLEVWTNPHGTPYVYKIQVVEPNTDVPVVKIP